MIAALGHAGGQGSSAYSQGPLLAPSRVPEVNTREVPKWMEESDIEAVIDGFARAAAVAVEADCDGVEINAGQFSLVRQFLSGLTDERDDNWGSDRSRFARLVLERVRDAVGPDRVLGLRLSCDELAPWAGIVPEAAAELAVELVESADYLTVVRGSIYTADLTRPDGHVEPGFNLGLVGDIRTAVREAHDDRVPVIAQGSIVEWGQAEWAVDDGARADGVEMTRALLADAHLVAKLANDGRGTHPPMHSLQPDVPGARCPEPDRDLCRRPEDRPRDVRSRSRAVAVDHRWPDGRHDRHRRRWRARRTGGESGCGGERGRRQAGRAAQRPRRRRPPGL